MRPRIAEYRPRRILEIGSGVGGFAARLAEITDVYVGVEPSDRSREIARSRLARVPGARATVVAGLVEVTEQERFDLVCAFEVLEHIENDRAALHDWLCRVKPGGELLISVPAFADRYRAADAHVGHFRRYDPADLRALAEDVGLVDVRTQVYGFPAGVVLEAVRNALARRAQRTLGTADEGMETRTDASGRWFQPSARLGVAVEVVTLPARWLQRRFPNRGTGLLLSGRRPDSDMP